MEILQTVLPKGPNTFDFSGIENYPFDEDYEHVSIGFNIMSASEFYGLATIYINGVKTYGVNIDSRYTKRYLTMHYTEFSGDLSNAIITAYTHSAMDGTINRPISISEAYITRDYAMPSLAGITVKSLYVNGYSEIVFRGSKYCEGMAGAANGGKSFREHAVPGSIIIGPGAYDTIGKILVPPGCFIEGVNQGYARAINHTKDQSGGIDATYGAATILPTTVTNFKFTSNIFSKDKPNVCTWIASPQQFKYQLKYKPQSSEEVVLNEMELTEESYTFAPGALPEGSITVSVRIFDGVYWSEWVNTNITTYAHKVTSLEPSGVAQLKDEPIIATWDSSDPQLAYEFKYAKSGVYQPTITGTTVKKHVFPPNTFGVETVTMELRTYNGYVWSDWKVVSFITFGKPNTPVITSPTTFNTAYPTFEWEVLGQTGYNLQILDDELVIYDTGDVVSGMRSYGMSKALDNNKTYILRLSIKNQYGYNSDYASQVFSIKYEELQKPSFTIFSDYINGAHIIDIINTESELFKECEVHRKEEGKDWVRIAKGLPRITQFRDVTVRSNVTYYYKVRAVSTFEGISDSSVKLSYTRLKYAQLLDIITTEITMLKVNFKRNVTLEQDMSEKFYAGRKTPVVSYGEKKYKVISVSFAVKTFTEKERFENLYYSRPTLLYRDNRGEKLYCYISQKPKINPTKNYWTIEFALTEQSYVEEV